MKLLKYIFRIVSLNLFFLFLAIVASASSIDTVFFTVSMEKPNTHYFHIEMEYHGVNKPETSFKIPAWTPGYYWIIDFAKNVTNFSATDKNGKALNYSKTDKDTWTITGVNNGVIKISYDVFAYQRSVAEPFLDDGRAFIAPTGVFMYPDGNLQLPVKVKIVPFKEWENINTGLDKANEENTFVAPNFDVLYDSPILCGNHKVYSFEVDDIPYTYAIENPVEIDFDVYFSDLKKIVESATTLIDDIPYKHYTFLVMDKGYGGLEHSNSMAVFSNSNYDITKGDGYKGWLAFIAHEFFHLYNVKRIRPITLGPFDYSKENLTNMLWVAEGFTVYYEYLVLNQAGLMPRQEVLDELSRVISTFENANGRKHISATQSSYDTWLNFFNMNNHTQNTVISYYDIGCALGMLLDLKIRHETNNNKSLDDVMRVLYYDFHKKQNRGYTDDEFREVCENIAGCTLEEIFHYAETTEAMDYQKYLNYAGIKINLNKEEETSFGLVVRNYTITNIDRKSPAWESGLSVNDKILLIDGEEVTEENLSKLVHPLQEGKIRVKVSRRTGEKEFTIESFNKETCNYKMQVNSDLNNTQKKILAGWVLE